MMSVATICRFTSDRLCRWLMAGQDDAWPQRPSATLRDPPAVRSHRRYDAHPARCSLLPLARSRLGYIDRRALRHSSSPNPHSPR
jgi:hypothetical protein